MPRMCELVQSSPIYLNKLDLDRGAHTTLQQEYLTNGDGDLEIIKIYDCSVQRMRGFKVVVNALHPSADGVEWSCYRCAILISRN